MPNAIIQDIETIPESRIVPIGKVAGVRVYADLAIATDDQTLVVIGWIFDPQEKVRGLAVLQQSPGETADPGATKPGLGNWLSTAVQRGTRRSSRNYLKLAVEHDVDGMQMVRVERPDVSAAMSQHGRLATDSHGFILVVPLMPDKAGIAFELNDGRYGVLDMKPLRSPPDIVNGLRQLTNLSPATLLTALRASVGESHPLFAMARELPVLARSGTVAAVRPAFAGIKRKTTGRMGAVLADISRLPSSVEKPETILACVDRGYPLGEVGIVFFGWYFCPKRQPASISVYDELGNQTVIDGIITQLSRLDVVSAYGQRFQNVEEMCGFACLAPVPTAGGELRALCFDFGEFGEVWLNIPSERPYSSGISLAKDMLGMVANPAQVRIGLFDIFDMVLGKAVGAVIGARRPVKDDIDVLQFGVAPEKPEVSVIVPLYGRYDFLRHQLAHFADDPDFKSADLIYVVDDASITAAALDLAAKYHELFGVPFRVVWYGENRGYASANNIGAGFARGRHIVLLNSDVIPQHGGWLSTLSAALEELPDAAAVGPLLQFGDGSIQHAGMYPRVDVSWPGFILNAHRDMGMVWSGGDKPSEHPMLTAACIMVRAADFKRIGGFDENYLIGDFEDSDLCLSLREGGKRHYLVPAAKLWHLERQSQNLSMLAGQRQMLTLYNAWRYNTKIRNGKLADPMSVEVSQ